MKHILLIGMLSIMGSVGQSWAQQALQPELSAAEIKKLQATIQMYENLSEQRGLSDGEFLALANARDQLANNKYIIQQNLQLRLKDAEKKDPTAFWVTLWMGDMMGQYQLSAALYKQSILEDRPYHVQVPLEYLPTTAFSQDVINALMGKYNTASNAAEKNNVREAIKRLYFELKDYIKNHQPTLYDEPGKTPELQSLEARHKNLTEFLNKTSTRNK